MQGGSDTTGGGDSCSGQCEVTFTPGKTGRVNAITKQAEVRQQGEQRVQGAKYKEPGLVRNDRFQVAGRQGTSGGRPGGPRC